MVSVQIPADIRIYKSKLVWGLSIRQIISIAAALIICVPLGVYGRAYIPEDLLVWMIILIAMPFAAWGFLTIQDMRFEELVRVIYRYLFLPQRRIFEDTSSNLFCHLQEEMMEEKIIEQRIQNGEYERTGGGTH